MVKPALLFSSKPSCPSRGSLLCSYVVFVYDAGAMKRLSKVTRRGKWLGVSSADCYHFPTASDLVQTPSAGKDKYIPDISSSSLAESGC